MSSSMNWRSGRSAMDERRRRSLVVYTLLLILFVGGCSHLDKPRSPVNLENPPQTFKTGNGMTVIVQREDSLPLATLDMWVRVGSGDEPSEIAGISHFLEHMLFKGTERLEVGEYDRRIEGLGGYLNAATSLDYTHYYVVFPSEHLGRVLEDFADVLMNSAIDAEEVERERMVILEEIRQKNDSPFGYLYDRTFSAIYESGPYSHPVIGSSESVRAITREQLAEHFERFYTADNMYLAVVGNVNAREVREKVEQAFSGQREAVSPWRDEVPPVVYTEATDRSFPRDWQEGYYLLSFPGSPGGRLHDMAVAELAQAVLAGGRSSRLVNRIVEKKAVASSISAYCPSNRYSMPVMVYGSCRAERLEEVRTEVFAELARLGEDGITEDEFRRARRQVLNGHLYSLETNAGRAATIGWSQVMLGKPVVLTDYDEAILAVTKHDVEKYIREHFVESRSSFNTSAPAVTAGGGRVP